MLSTKKTKTPTTTRAATCAAPAGTTGAHALTKQGIEEDEWPV